MALLRPYDKDGVHYPEAYSRITSIRMDVESTYVFVTTHATYQDRLDGKYPIAAEEPVMPTADVVAPIYPAMYAFVKTQPGFEQAVDFNPDEGVASENEAGPVVDPQPVIDPELMS
jgi:hypothetical protein